VNVWLRPQERIWIDVSAFPVAFRIGDHGDRKVQMVIAWSGVSGVADVSNHLALANFLSFEETRSVAREVSVVEDQFLVWTKLIDRGAASLALKEARDGAVLHGLHWGVARGKNVDRLVRAGTAAPILERAHQLLAFDSLYRNVEIPSREILGRPGFQHRR